MAKYLTSKIVEEGLIERIKVEGKKDSLDKTQSWKELRQIIMPLIEAIAEKYSKYGFTINELVNEGEKGAKKALFYYIEGEERPYKYSTYASWWIRQFILEKVKSKSSK